MPAPTPPIGPRPPDPRRVQRYAHVRLVLGIAQLVSAGLTVALLFTRGPDGPSVGAARRGPQ